MNKREMKKYLKERGVTPSLYQGWFFQMAADAIEAFDAIDTQLREIIDTKSRTGYKISWEEIEHDIDVYEEVELKLFGRVRPY